MRNHKFTTFLVIFTVAVTVLTAVTRLRANSKVSGSGQEQEPTAEEWERYRRRLERESKFPEVEFEAPEPADPEKRAKRKLKNSRYDKHGFAIKDPSTRVGEVSRESEWDFHVKGIPAAQSDAVIIGEVLSKEAHLSNDKTAVYTELGVRVVEVLKCNHPSALAPNRVVEVDRLGGFVRYPNGHRRLYREQGRAMPEVGRRYVLFLNTKGESPNYSLLTGYELGGGGVVPLDDSTTMGAYKGMDEQSFLQAVRDAAAPPP